MSVISVFSHSIICSHEKYNVLVVLLLKDVSPFSSLVTLSYAKYHWSQLSVCRITFFLRGKWESVFSFLDFVHYKAWLPNIFCRIVCLQAGGTFSLRSQFAPSHLSDIIVFPCDWEPHLTGWHEEPLWLKQKKKRSYLLHFFFITNSCLFECILSSTLAFLLGRAHAHFLRPMPLTSHQ